MSDVEGSLKLAAVLISVGGASVFRGLKQRKHLRAIEDTPCSTIQSAAQGLCEIQGHTLAFSNVFTTIEGRKAAFRELKIQKYVKRGKNSKWQTIHEEREGTTLIVSDGTGIAEIWTSDAEMYLKERMLMWNSLARRRQEELYSRYGSLLTGVTVGGGFWSWLQPRYRFVEKAIHVGGPIYARGYFKTDSKLAPYSLSPQAYRFLGHVAELKRAPAKRKKLFDLNRDGIIDESELEYGSLILHEQSAADVLPSDSSELVRIQGMMNHDQNHGLVIGDSHQEHLSQRLSRWSHLMIWGGIVAVACGVGLIGRLFIW